MTTIELLEQTYTMFDDKSLWATGAEAYDIHGEQVGPRDIDAISWCAIGGLYKNADGRGDTIIAALGALDDEAARIYGDHRDIIEVNDRLGYRQMRACFRAAIRRLKR